MATSEGIKTLELAAWVVTALGSVHVGLVSCGHNFLAHLGVAARPVEYVIGAFGVVSIVTFVLHFKNNR